MIVRAWRICMDEFAASAMTGLGAKLYGARWNSKGVPMVYAAENLSLAVLENLVRLRDPRQLKRWVSFCIEFDSSLMQSLDLAKLPSDWRVSPPPASTQKLGDQWAAAAESLVLRVPSAVIPQEACYLINPEHAAFDQLRVGSKQPIDVDGRVIFAGG